MAGSEEILFIIIFFNFFLLSSGYDMKGFRFKRKLDMLMEKSITGHWLQKHLSDKIQLLEGGRDSGGLCILNTSLAACCCSVLAVNDWA